ncbi:MAG: dihydrofolate synthase [Bacteroidetes bacterium RIFCSPLOWO2_12_FULL_37_12]|nr:MAG: dihydrofolate synthase [Bacteroidetes bacterium RIFCSPLOWO2_12_FULL_37_12]
MNSYQEAEEFLFKQLPMFHRIGGAAYKNNLDNIKKLSEFLDNPEKKFKSIHVAGTNGKGSTCHFLASIFQTAGYKTGLFTSPHLKSFRERIKINGIPIEESEVVEFVNLCKSNLEILKPSFFEMTTALAFDYFAKSKVDIAIIETGMGGRLDSTNIITPILSVITSISMDHTEFLGDTLKKIANEKSGIIKQGVPVVISVCQKETDDVFSSVAAEKHCDIYFAEKNYKVEAVRDAEDGVIVYFSVRKLPVSPFTFIETPLTGIYQSKNIPGVLKSVEILSKMGFFLNKRDVENGFAQVIKNTAFMGRWYMLQENPLIVCDVAHNEDGINHLMNQVSLMKFTKLIIVLGMVKEKESQKILKLLRKDAFYIFCEASIPRAKPAEELAEEARREGLNGIVEKKPSDALKLAKSKAGSGDFILITGSTFVVGEVI